MDGGRRLRTGTVLHHDAVFQAGIGTQFSLMVLRQKGYIMLFQPFIKELTGYLNGQYIVFEFYGFNRFKNQVLNFGGSRCPITFRQSAHTLHDSLLLISQLNLPYQIINRNGRRKCWKILHKKIFGLDFYSTITGVS